MRNLSYVSNQKTMHATVQSTSKVLLSLQNKTGDAQNSCRVSQSPRARPCNMLNQMAPPKAANHATDEPTSAALRRRRRIEWCMRELGDGHWRPGGL